jgi:hypothetical protein
MFRSQLNGPNKYITNHIMARTGSATDFTPYKQAGQLMIWFEHLFAIAEPWHK